MAENKSGGSHTVMPKKLAQALMDAGMQHFDVGGDVHNGFETYYADPLFNEPMQRFGHPGQSSYEAGAPNIDRQNFQPGIQASEQQQAGTWNAQNALAVQLLNQTQGKGPGQQMIAQQAGQNASTQGALMAGQRGANQNAALVGRQAAQQNAANNQNSLNAQANMQLQSQNALAQQQQAMSQGALNQQSILQGGQAAQNSAVTTGSLGYQGMNSQTAQKNASGGAGMMGGAGALMSMLSKGGQVPNLASGGLMTMQNYEAPKDYQGSDSGKDSGSSAMDSFSAVKGMMGEAKGGQIPFSQALLDGGSVPGKAKVQGDSKDNDTQPTMLSPGEVVIPRSIMNSPQMEKKAIEFLRHLKSKNKGYGSVVESRVQKKACGGKVY